MRSKTTTILIWVFLFNEKFSGRVITRNGDVNWSPRTWDWKALDYFLSGYVKSPVYKNNPQVSVSMKLFVIFNHTLGKMSWKILHRLNHFSKRIVGLIKDLKNHAVEKIPCNAIKYVT